MYKPGRPAAGKLRGLPAGAELQAEGSQINKEQPCFIVNTTSAVANSCLLNFGNGVKIRTLLDSGSDLSLIKKEVYDRISWKGPINESNTRLQAANGQALNVAGTAELTLKIGKSR